MNIQHVFRIVPVPVFYVNWLPFSAGGLSVAVFVFLLEKYREDKGLVEHELEHVQQSYRGLFIFHTLLYLLYTPYRQWAEIKAYRRQLAYYGPEHSCDFAVRALTTKYRLPLTIGEARKLLTEVL